MTTAGMLCGDGGQSYCCVERTTASSLGKGHSGGGHYIADGGQLK